MMTPTKQICSDNQMDVPNNSTLDALVPNLPEYILPGYIVNVDIALFSSFFCESLKSDLSQNEEFIKSVKSLCDLYSKKKKTAKQSTSKVQTKACKLKTICNCFDKDFKVLCSLPVIKKAKSKIQKRVSIQACVLVLFRFIIRKSLI